MTSMVRTVKVATLSQDPSRIVLKWKTKVRATSRSFWLVLTQEFCLKGGRTGVEAKTWLQ
jgi:hypothetical protein